MPRPSFRPARALLVLAALIVACADPVEGGDGSAGGFSGGLPSGTGGSSSTGEGLTSVDGEGASAGGSASDGATTSSSTSAASGVTGDTTGFGTDSDADTEGSSTTSDDGLPPDCPRIIVVAPGEVLNVRPTPSTEKAPIGTLSHGAIVDVLELVDGEVIDGDPGWFAIDFEGQLGYVSAAFADCTLDEPPDLQPPDGFYLPMTCGTTATVSQGNNGQYSHNGTSAYAFDFALGLNTSLVAVADGVTLFTFDKTGPGDPCYNGGGQECVNAANYVVLLHGDGTTSAYRHLNKVSVEIGEFVPRGAQVGLTGSTGWSTGRHAHVVRQQECGKPYCQSVAMEFVDAGVPKTGDQVTSQNCP